MRIQHVLITRFNLATRGREESVRHTSGWLENRFELFERFCLPTVAAQTEQGFLWVLYLDHETPAWARERLELCRAQREFTPFYTSLFDSAGWARSIRTVTGAARANALLTSNLDNDDGLAVDYIARVQAAAAAHFNGQRLAINVANGFVLNGNALYAHHHQCGAFTNMIESNDGTIRTTMTIRHTELPSRLPIVQENGPGGWLQVVHGANVSNRVRGRRAGRREATDRFPTTVVGNVVDPTAAGVFADRLILAPARLVRDRAFTTIRRVVRVDAGS